VYGIHSCAVTKPDGSQENRGFSLALAIIALDRTAEHDVTFENGDGEANGSDLPERNTDVRARVETAAHTQRVRHRGDYEAYETPYDIMEVHGRSAAYRYDEQDDAYYFVSGSDPVETRYESAGFR
jgi:hypothetical protein